MTISMSGPLHLKYRGNNQGSLRLPVAMCDFKVTTPSDAQHSFTFEGKRPEAGQVLRMPYSTALQLQPRHGHVVKGSVVNNVLVWSGTKKEAK
jgi:hypothetical protein